MTVLLGWEEALRSDFLSLNLSAFVAIRLPPLPHPKPVRARRRWLCPGTAARGHPARPSPCPLLRTRSVSLRPAAAGAGPVPREGVPGDSAAACVGATRSSADPRPLTRWPGPARARACGPAKSRGSTGTGGRGLPAGTRHDQLVPPAPSFLCHRPPGAGGGGGGWMEISPLRHSWMWFWAGMGAPGMFRGGEERGHGLRVPSGGRNRALHGERGRRGVGAGALARAALPWQLRAPRGAAASWGSTGTCTASRCPAPLWQERFHGLGWERKGDVGARWWHPRGMPGTGGCRGRSHAPAPPRAGTSARCTWGCRAGGRPSTAGATSTGG